MQTFDGRHPHIRREVNWGPRREVNRGPRREVTGGELGTFCMVNETFCIEAPTFFAGASKNSYPWLLRPDRAGTGGPGSRHPVTICPGQKTLFFKFFLQTIIDLGHGAYFHLLV